MGVVLRQSLLNTVLTYLGFLLGALNYMVLYIRFLSEAYFGLVGVILSTAALLTPIMSFGIPNTLIKFYSGLDSTSDKNRLLTYCFLLPLLVVLPLAGLSGLANEAIGAFLARQNAIVADYVWHIFIAGMAMAYFEVFFAWSKVSLKSVYGTFLKEVFIRAGVSFLLVLLYLGYFDEGGFLNALVGIYLLRTVLMFIYGWRLRPVTIDIQLPPGLKYIVKYTLLIIIGGSVAVLLLEVDRFMINQFLAIENVAYYSLAIFMATIIIVPWRAMHQITYPLTAKLVSENNWDDLQKLYQKSSLHLFMISGWIFLLLFLNLNEIYALVPEAYSAGAVVVIVIGAIKVYDSFLGINTSILYNSKYYISLLLMGILLAVLTVSFNLYFIPRYGLTGAAYATALAVICYNTLKLAFVWKKMKLHPLSKSTLIILIIGVLTYLLGSIPVDLGTPVLTIFIKSLGITVVFGGMIWFLDISPELNQLLGRYIKIKRPRN